jgi:cell wall-associated NlpC family hydrolase
MNRNFIMSLIAAVSTAAIPSMTLADYSYEAPKARVIKTVNFREMPSTSGDAIRYLKVGETLSVLNETNRSWLQVSSSGTYIQRFAEKVSPPSNGKVLKSVSFRQGPSVDDSRIRYLKSGELIWVLDKVNKYWYKVADTNNIIGYVSTGAEYIETAYGETEEPPEETFVSPPNATAVSSVSFRTGPSTDSTRIRYLSSGEKLLVLDKTNDYWYYVQDQTGALGYVSSDKKYITTTYVEPYKQMNLTEAADKVVQAGKAYMGTPYEFGSSRFSTSTFDCSDFVRQAYMDGIGQLLPGDSRSQAAYVKGIGKVQNNWANLKKGDLMFFMSSKGYGEAAYTNVNKAEETVTHVGIYLGNGQVLHTYSVESGGVRIDTIDGSQWELRFLFGGTTY